jgi:putative FmdB family regulatory protein
MPIYEYHCKKCQALFDVLQSLNANSLMECVNIECDGIAERIISATAHGQDGKYSYRSK